MHNKYISYTITLLFVLLFVAYAFLNKELISGLAAVSVSTLILVMIGRIIMMANNAIVTKVSISAYGYSIKWRESFYIGIYGAIGNFFGPLLGGAGVRAVYFKKKYSISYSKFSSTVMGNYLIVFTLNTFIAIISLLKLGSASDDMLLFLFFVIWFIAMVGFYFIKLPNKNSKVPTLFSKSNFGAFIIKHIYMAEEGWNNIKKTPGLILRLYVLAILNFIIVLFISYVEFSAINASVSLPALALYTVFINISMLLSFTPGSIGVREALMIMISSTLAVTTTEILQVAVIDRAVTFLILGILMLTVRSGRLKRILVKE